ncbi:glycine-rich protein [Streptomyces sp. NPDC059918]|uniref:glycine-rich protein n=1 Tax=unclassified Streptomyces TaxID=2593676 RepID=UPI00365F6E4B
MKKSNLLATSICSAAAAAFLALSLTGTAAFAAGKPTGHAEESVVFDKPGAVETFTVPNGVTTLTLEAVGGHGADVKRPNGEVSEGGAGAHIEKATVDVTAGSTYKIIVGGNAEGAKGGANGGGSGVAFDAKPESQQIDGGGGGGATSVYKVNPEGNAPVLIAGGGGGAAAYFKGGEAGQPGAARDPQYSGGGGTASAGGKGGENPFNKAGDGSAGQGGNATKPENPPQGRQFFGGAGGGGGYFGGGASTCSGGPQSGGAGGGSSYGPGTRTDTPSAKPFLEISW